MKEIFTFLLVGLFYLSLHAQSNITITSSCDDITICNNSSDCSNMFAELTATATTDCSISNDLVFSYQIDLFDDGSNEFSEAVATVGEDFPLGTHRIIFTITDECSTSEVCDYLFEIKDCGAPIPVCIFGIATTVMPSSGSLTIYATDFESGDSYDNCSDYTDLHFSFSQDINNTFLTIECDDIPVDFLYPITLYITDEAGNFDFCSTFVNIQDPNQVCDFPVVTTGLVSTVSPEDCQMEGTNYYINGLPNFTPGPFSITSLNIGDEVAPFYDNSYLNGVTTYDVVLISKHILNLNLFDEPWQLIAADANQNGVITSLDNALFRALILQNITQLPNANSWVFDPSSFIYNGAMTSFEFLGIKLGDVNGTAAPGSCFQNPNVDNRTLQTLEFSTKNQSFKTGETITMKTFSNNFDKIIGGQFTLDFDPTALEFKNISGNSSIELTEQNFGKTMTNEGVILCSWNTATSQNLTPDEAFYNITFTAKKDGKLSDYLTINSKKLANEIYFENGSEIEFWNAELIFKNEVIKTELSISPNPFSEKTIFSFSLEKEGQVELEIFDTNGRLVFSQIKNMHMGENQIEIIKEDLPLNGIYFYIIKTDNHLNSGKLILF